MLTWPFEVLLDDRYFDVVVGLGVGEWKAGGRGKREEERGKREEEVPIFDISIYLQQYLRILSVFVCLRDYCHPYVKNK
jgi:hypothetical protein